MKYLKVHVYAMQLRTRLFSQEIASYVRKNTKENTNFSTKYAEKLSFALEFEFFLLSFEFFLLEFFSRWPNYKPGLDM